MKPKKPKYLRHPKKNKRTIDSMEKYLNKCAEVDKTNRERDNSYKKDLKKYEDLRKRVDRM